MELESTKKKNKKYNEIQRDLEENCQGDNDLNCKQLQ